MAIWTFVRLTLREASRSRLLAIGAALTLVYIGMVAWGTSKLVERTPNALVAATAGLTIEIMAFFLGSFMLTLLAVFVSGHSVHQEADSGLLQAVLAKPVRRFDVLAGRWLGSAFLLALWVALFSLGISLAVGLNVGFYPPHPVQAGLLLLLEALVMLSLRLLFGSFLGTLASGIVPLLVFGFAWMGGLVETVGDNLSISSMINGGIVSSLLVPTDAVWRGASYFLLPDITALAGLTGEANPARGIPFVSLVPIAAPMVIWSVLYVAAVFAIGARIFARRDV